jgi:hypothetical protein
MKRDPADVMAAMVKAAAGIVEAAPAAMPEGEGDHTGEIEIELDEDGIAQVGEDEPAGLAVEPLRRRLRRRQAEKAEMIRLVQAEKAEMIRLVKLCEQNASAIGQVRLDWQSSVRSLLGSQSGSKWSPYDVCADGAEKAKRRAGGRARSAQQRHNPCQCAFCSTKPAPRNTSSTSCAR